MHFWYSDACPGQQVTWTVSWEHHALLGSVGGGAWVPGSIKENFWRPLSTTRTSFRHVRISHTRKKRDAGEKAQHVQGQADDKLCREEPSRYTVCKQEASVWGGKRTKQPEWLGIPLLFKGSSARQGAQVNSYGTIRNAIRGSKYLLRQMESPRKPNTVWPVLGTNHR